jgi:hypothetical protein
MNLIVLAAAYLRYMVMKWKFTQGLLTVDFIASEMIIYENYEAGWENNCSWLNYHFTLL